MHVQQEKCNSDEYIFEKMSLLFRKVLPFNASDEQSAKYMNHCAQFGSALAAVHIGSLTISTIGSVGNPYDGQNICKEGSNNRYPQYDAIIFGEAFQINDADVAHVLFVNSQDKHHRKRIPLIFLGILGIFPLIVY